MDLVDLSLNWTGTELHLDTADSVASLEDSTRDSDYHSITPRNYRLSTDEPTYAYVNS